ncbi:Oidioi.mRNA.OKI2018_I69.chr2.g4941.t1.cds [Oikopleura dioica]|uniref:Oidioi.mRNA.OKI2018_I69.chr2.g4941.t1.cds n=1 Tax=Oikopleura dioica TaxID=34765 RepID=A0ABN7T817_OIKDI|nr:Oidioi.mRNA.OKI2018_I69.chr2.g4941.t1.cds [Oikopleura dioica]
MMVPWYPTLGNHDWAMLPADTEGDRKGNGWAQIEYSAHGSGRWTFPDLFYTIEYTTSDDTKVKIIMIETTSLTGIHSSKKPGPDRTDQNCKNPYNLDCELKRLNPLFPELVEWAWEWVENELESSGDVDYLFAAGHYQIVETGGIWDYQLFRHLDPLFEKYGVQAYFQGHRHTHEHATRSPKIQPEGLDFELPGSVHYITTGAGAHYDTETMLFEQYLGQDIPTRSGCHPKFEKQGNDMGEAICYYYWANQNSSKQEDGGFVSVKITKEKAIVRMITSETYSDENGRSIGHEFEILPRNK